MRLFRLVLRLVSQCALRVALSNSSSRLSLSSNLNNNVHHRACQRVFHPAPTDVPETTAITTAHKLWSFSKTNRTSVLHPACHLVSHHVFKRYVTTSVRSNFRVWRLVLPLVNQCALLNASSNNKLKLSSFSNPNNSVPPRVCPLVSLAVFNRLANQLWKFN